MLKKIMSWHQSSWITDTLEGCIHSQQAVEKCMKGLLIKNRWERERTHNIGTLFSFAAKYGINMKIDDDDIEFIDSIYSGRKGSASIW